MTDLHEALRRSRARARYSQDDVGAALGVSRAMVSYWEAGSRAPNDRQLSALARLFGVAPADLAEGRDVEPADVDLAGMLLRADEDVDPGAAPGSGSSSTSSSGTPNWPPSLAPPSAASRRAPSCIGRSSCRRTTSAARQRRSARSSASAPARSVTSIPCANGWGSPSTGRLSARTSVTRPRERS